MNRQRIDQSWSDPIRRHFFFFWRASFCSHRVVLTPVLRSPDERSRDVLPEFKIFVRNCTEWYRVQWLLAHSGHLFFSLTSARRISFRISDVNATCVLNQCSLHLLKFTKAGPAMLTIWPRNMNGPRSFFTAPTCFVEIQSFTI